MRHFVNHFVFFFFRFITHSLPMSIKKGFKNQPKKNYNLGVKLSPIKIPFFHLIALFLDIKQMFLLSLLTISGKSYSQIFNFHFIFQIKQKICIKSNVKYSIQAGHYFSKKKTELKDLTKNSNIFNK